MIDAVKLVLQRIDNSTSTVIPPKSFTKTIDAEWITDIGDITLQLERFAGEVIFGEYSVFIDMSYKSSGLREWLNSNEGGMLYNLNGVTTYVQADLYLTDGETVRKIRGNLTGWSDSIEDLQVRLSFYTGLGRLKVFREGALDPLRLGTQYYKGRSLNWVLEQCKGIADITRSTIQISPLTSDSPFFSYAEHPEARWCVDTPSGVSNTITPTEMPSFVYYHNGIIYTVAGQHLIGYTISTKAWHYYLNLLYVINHPPYQDSEIIYGFKVLTMRYNTVTNKLEIVVIVDNPHQFGQGNYQDNSWDMKLLEISV